MVLKQLITSIAFGIAIASSLKGQSKNLVLLSRGSGDFIVKYSNPSKSDTVKKWRRSGGGYLFSWTGNIDCKLNYSTSEIKDTTSVRIWDTKSGISSPWLKISPNAPLNINDFLKPNDDASQVSMVGKIFDWLAEKQKTCSRKVALKGNPQKDSLFSFQDSPQWFVSPESVQIWWKSPLELHQVYLFEMGCQGSARIFSDHSIEKKLYQIPSSENEPDNLWQFIPKNHSLRLKPGSIYQLVLCFDEDCGPFLRRIFNFYVSSPEEFEFELIPLLESDI